MAKKRTTRKHRRPARAKQHRQATEAKKRPPRRRTSDRAGRRAAKNPAALTTREASESTSAPLTIVGIGASAGGLEALTALLQQLPRESDMAYVVVQHLAPRHESALPELLSASSPLTVTQVRDGMQLRASRVHVIPPNVQMTVTDGKLRLAPRPSDGTQHHPIDSFFRSLAEHAQDRAVGVVLSGSATDGAIGLREIKSVGGITFAQDPKSAKYDGMPRAAIATGVVDYVGNAEQIGQELAQLGSHPFLRAAPIEDNWEDVTFTDKQLERVFVLLRNASGVDFSHYKLPTIKRRLQRRMVLHKTTRLDEYLRILHDQPDEVKNLYKDILIHVTRFFRDPDSFETLKKAVFPRIVDEAASRRPIRVWVPGCATGEEAYSIAIALLEFLGTDAPSVPVQVFATDVSQDAIERARLGLYPETIAADVSPVRLRRFFTPVDSQYRISKLVRDSCIFARQDLTRDPPFSKLDLIVCRNVLIYLGQRLQRRLMSVFHYALRPTGFLMLGSTESIAGYSDYFSVVEKRHKVFAKRVGQTPPEVMFRAAREDAFEREHPVRRQTRPFRPTDVQQEVTRLLVGRYSPPGVVVDHDFQIVHTRGRTGPYLELAGGDPSLNLVKMAREGLLHGLRNALNEARKTLRPTRREGLQIKINGTTREIDVQVLPLKNDNNDPPLFLVLFEPSRQVKGRGGVKRSGKSTPEKDRRVNRLQQELSSSREYMQSIIQDLEAANEELQSANEEILSSNEELQSTNEELDTAKEELQSTNEELNTVNEELNARNEELSHVNSDLVNLLTAVPAAVVIVSADLRIRRFTPMAEHVLNLIPTDVGRPLRDINPNLDTADLEELTRGVIDTVTTKEFETRDRFGREYAVRIRPYKNQENRIDGAVLAFSDVYASRPSEADVTRSVNGLVDCVSSGLLVLDTNLNIQAINASALKLLGAKSGSHIGRPLRQFAEGQLDQRQLTEALERLRDSGAQFSGIVADAPHTAHRRVLIDGTRTADRAPLLVLTLREPSSSS